MEKKQRIKLEKSLAAYFKDIHKNTPMVISGKRVSIRPLSGSLKIVPSFINPK